MKFWTFWPERLPHRFCNFEITTLKTFLKSKLNSQYFEEKEHPHGFCISEITTSINVVRSMSKKSGFRGPFNKQHRKRAQALLKSASVDLYPIVWSLKCQLCWKKSLLLTCQILGLLVKALAANKKYPLLKRDHLTIPIQMQLSQKEETSSLFSAAFLKSTWNFEHFDKKAVLIGFVILKLRTLKTLSDKCLKSSVWENPLTSNMVNMPKHCSNLHHITFIRFIDNCQVNGVGKNLSHWHNKS